MAVESSLYLGLLWSLCLICSYGCKAVIRITVAEKVSLML